GRTTPAGGGTVAGPALRRSSAGSGRRPGRLRAASGPAERVPPGDRRPAPAPRAHGTPARSGAAARFAWWPEQPGRHAHPRRHAVPGPGDGGHKRTLPPHADGIAELSTTLNQTGAVRQSGGYGGKPLRLPGEGANHRDNTTGGRMAQGSAAAKSNAGSRVFTEGMRVLWTAIRTEPAVFTAALVGAVLYAAASVASASVLGAVSEQVILPAVENGRTTTAAVATAAAAVFGVGA